MFIPILLYSILFIYILNFFQPILFSSIPFFILSPSLSYIPSRTLYCMNPYFFSPLLYFSLFYFIFLNFHSSSVFNSLPSLSYAEPPAFFHYFTKLYYISLSSSFLYFSTCMNFSVFYTSALLPLRISLPSFPFQFTNVLHSFPLFFSNTLLYLISHNSVFVKSSYHTRLAITPAFLPLI